MLCLKSSEKQKSPRKPENTMLCKVEGLLGLDLICLDHFLFSSRGVMLGSLPGQGSVRHGLEEPVPRGFYGKFTVRTES